VDPIENNAVDDKHDQKHGPDNERRDEKENIRQSNVHGLASVFDINEKQETEVPEIMARRGTSRRACTSR
jgi:hypothetical protein